MVYFHAVDIVLDRKASIRTAWVSRCYLPKIVFDEKKTKTKGLKSSKYMNYNHFKRMLAVKSVVYERHNFMLQLYEQYCREASRKPYWGESEGGNDSSGDACEVVEAEDTNEADCDDGF